MMNLPRRHDILILGTDLDTFEQKEVEVVAIDTEEQLFTVYNAKDDELTVIIVNANGQFRQVQYLPVKEPWEA